MNVVERFAPSPTGLLHIGHGYSALLSYEAAQAAGGNWLLRIEDIDGARARAEYEAAIYRDLEWLGLKWQKPVLRQSERMAVYDDALADLRARGLVYGCACTRGDIKAALSARQEGDITSAPYPGTCRDKGLTGDGLAWRIDMKRAFELAIAQSKSPLGYEEIGSGKAQWIDVDGAKLNALGDVVLARRDIGTSYHLAVVIDDGAQGVTHVTRGMDMAADTAIHVILQRILGLPTPIYRHHGLIRDENGKRLAKRDDARSIASYRAAGFTPEMLKKRMLEMLD